jgi:hypothetical protein
MIDTRSHMDTIDAIMEYEAGTLSDVGTIELFAELVRTGTAWSLQGHYGRAAASLIENGVIDSEGNILVDLDAFA